MALVAESGKTAGTAKADMGPGESGGGQSLKPLRLLVPYILRYRLRASCAFVALVVAALATLAVPIAIRRMIDFGFSGERSLIDNYFAVMIGVVFVLAMASAVRYYLVTTLGERIVTDLREQVFRHLTALSPAFFDRAQTGEMMSRLTADTTQIKAAVGASISVALRNLVLFIGAGAMMVITSPKLSLFVLAAIPVIVLPLVAFGRAVRKRSRLAQDSLADASAYAAETIGSVRVVAGLHERRLCREAFRQCSRDRLSGGAAIDPVALGADGDRHIPDLRKRRDRALGRRAGCAVRSDDAGPAEPVRALCGIRGRRPRQLSEVWGEVQQASGAAERLFEILAVKTRGEGAGQSGKAAGSHAGRDNFRECSLRLSDTAGYSRARRRFISRGTRRESCDRGSLGCGQKHDLPSDFALLRSEFRARDLRRHQYRADRSAGSAPSHRAGAAGGRDFRRLDPRQYRLRQAGGDAMQRSSVPQIWRRRPNSSAACRRALRP